MITYFIYFLVGFGKDYSFAHHKPIFANIVCINKKEKQNMSKFYPLRVSKINRETENAVSLELDTNGFADEFNFKQGQYITFKVLQNGEELHRSYSICSAPHENVLQVAVKKVESGVASTFLSEKLSEGDTLEAMSPEGNFTIDLNPENKKHYIFFAAGSGITPVFSLVKAALNEEANSKVTLFYGNSSEKDIIFKEQLETISESEGDRFRLFHILTDGSQESALFNGRITFGKATELFFNFCQDEFPKEFFICGPAEMMKSVKNSLTDNGVEKNHIHLEYFVPPGEENPEIVKEGDKEKDEKLESGYIGEAEIQVELDDEDFEITLHTDGDPILDAVLDSGSDAPYSCRGGVCTTCKAKLIEGTVKMDSNFALTDEEIEEGYILTCQSHPTSAKVKISYDDI